MVKPGAIDSGWMAVEAKLEPGEKVVIDGTDRLREGGKVEVIAADPKQRAGASAPPPDSKRRNIPPEMAEKLKNMSPEERRAWLQQNGGGKRDKQDKPAAPSN